MNSNPDCAALLTPVYRGLVKSSLDAAYILQACSERFLTTLPRPILDHERKELIKSGNVFVYRKLAGILEWTDGLLWTHSGRSGQFQIYHEVEVDYEAMERKWAPAPVTNSCTLPPPFPGAVPFLPRQQEENPSAGPFETEYRIKPGGLIKRTMTAAMTGLIYRLVAYHNDDDLEADSLPVPLTDKMFQKIVLFPPRYKLIPQPPARGIILRNNPMKIEPSRQPTPLPPPDSSSQWLGFSNGTFFIRSGTSDEDPTLQRPTILQISHQESRSQPDGIPQRYLNPLRYDSLHRDTSSPTPSMSSCHSDSSGSSVSSWESLPPRPVSNKPHWFLFDETLPEGVARDPMAYYEEIESRLEELIKQALNRYKNPNGMEMQMFSLSSYFQSCGVEEG